MKKETCNFSWIPNFCSVQGDFESCADILTCDRTPKKLTIKPIMSYTNIDIFLDKGDESFSKKNWQSLSFTKNGSKKIVVDFLCCHLIQN
jgi:hypothetical protein